MSGLPVDWDAGPRIERCACGYPAKYFPLIGLTVEPMCVRCYGLEFPERLATFELVRRDPTAGEFNDPLLRDGPVREERFIRRHRGCGR